jgi:hypothetical protein
MTVPPATCSYDVHCFGKVLLELVTGNLSTSGPSAAVASEESEWLTNTLNYISAGDKAAITNIIDPLLLVDEDHLEEVWAVAIIAKTCLNSKPSRRPSARYVLRALENPLRVARASSSRSNSARQLRSSSSRSSWQSVFQGGNGRVQSLDVAAAASGRAPDRRHSARSYGSGGASFSLTRAPPTPEIVPEPPARRDDGAVV